MMTNAVQEYKIDLMSLNSINKYIYSIDLHDCFFLSEKKQGNFR